MEKHSRDRGAHCRTFFLLFTEMMRSVHVESDEILVSFDVSSLFTNVPVDEAISVICERFREDETLGDRTILSPERVAELVEMCLKSTYFSHGGSFYEQKEGAAMGFSSSTRYSEGERMAA